MENLNESEDPVVESEPSHLIYDYDPVEGVDYLVDLYALSGVERDAQSEDIKSAIRKKRLEYHPDRLQGLAPEFIASGEIVIRLLERANSVLLDETKRQQYDGLLNNWDGPLSQNGTPVITMKAYEQAKLAQMSPEEIESEIASKRQKVEMLIGYDPDKIARLELGATHLTDELKTLIIGPELEAALLDYDRVLAIEEAERFGMLGIEGRGYNAALGYSGDVAVELTVAKETFKQNVLDKAENNISEQLALLTGETSPSESQLVPSIGDLSTEPPAYFDDQSEKILELAKQREEILNKRLDVFEPKYLLPDLQSELLPQFIIGVDSPDKMRWFTFNYTVDDRLVNATSFNYDEQTLELLNNGDYEAIINSGFNIFTIKLLDQVEVRTVINAAIGKHFKRFGVGKDQE